MIRVIDKKTTLHEYLLDSSNIWVLDKTSTYFKFLFDIFKLFSAVTWKKDCEDRRIFARLPGYITYPGDKKGNE